MIFTGSMARRRRGECLDDCGGAHGLRWTETMKGMESSAASRNHRFTIPFSRCQFELVDQSARK